MKRKILLFLAIVLVVTAFAGCSKKEPMTGPKFAEKAEEFGFTVVESEEVHDGIDKVYVANKGENTFLDFFVAKSNDYAQMYFNEMKASVEGMEGNLSTTSSVNIGSFSSYALTTADNYYHVTKIDNTVMYMETPKSEKSSAEEFLKAVGYK